ncbi:alpha/beta fold hydrolase [Sporichthya polymorpha]|uniref:alpha/beta fold hydrolase n=1 Tax=Sporichthya polymorpha TaxID=35751 RepID=UPI00035D72ED|nr:alpha/beta hydrolase [Sporichthya polymorpha]
MARTTALGEWREAKLSEGAVLYADRGQGEPVVFVHGLLVNADLWRKVVPDVAAAGFRCVSPDLPFGAHQVPVPEADLSPTGAADLIAEFLEHLNLRDVTLVANDTGGAITQILMTRHPERIGRVVLTSCDAFERFPPRLFAYLPWLAKLPGSMWVMAQTLRMRWTHNLPITFRWVTKGRFDDETIESFLGPTRRSAEVRKDLRRFLRGVKRRHLLAAAEELPRFDKPVLLAWASEDRIFPVADAYRLAGVLPNAEVVEIADSYTFVSEDQPQHLAEVVVRFAGRHDAADASPRHADAGRAAGDRA